MTGRPTCTELSETRAELALGLLSGTDRAAAVSHLAGCPSCRDDVDEMAGVADRLLLLAPQADPPPGFETRVLTAVAGARVPASAGRHRAAGRRRGGRTLAGLGAAVVAATLVLAGGVGVVRSRDDRTPAAAGPVSGGSVRTALSVSPSGRATCRVVVSGTRPATVLVSLDAPPGASGEYDVAVQQAGGSTIQLGRLALSHGHGLLARSVPVDADTLTTVVMYDEDDKVLYEARLSEPAVTPVAPTDDTTAGP